MHQEYANILENLMESNGNILKGIVTLETVYTGTRCLHHALVWITNIIKDNNGSNNGFVSGKVVHVSTQLTKHSDMTITHWNELKDKVIPLQRLLPAEGSSFTRSAVHVLPCENRNINPYAEFCPNKTCDMIRCLRAKGDAHRHVAPVTSTAVQHDTRLIPLHDQPPVTSLGIDQPSSVLQGGKVVVSAVVSGGPASESNHGDNGKSAVEQDVEDPTRAEKPRAMVIETDCSSQVASASAVAQSHVSSRYDTSGALGSELDGLDMEGVEVVSRTTQIGSEFGVGNAGEIGEFVNVGGIGEFVNVADFFQSDFHEQIESVKRIDMGSSSSVLGKRSTQHVALDSTTHQSSQIARQKNDEVDPKSSQTDESVTDDLMSSSHSDTPGESFSKATAATMNEMMEDFQREQKKIFTKQFEFMQTGKSDLVATNAKLMGEKKVLMTTNATLLLERKELSQKHTTVQAENAFLKHTLRTSNTRLQKMMQLQNAHTELQQNYLKLQEVMKVNYEHVKQMSTTLEPVYAKLFSVSDTTLACTDALVSTDTGASGSTLAFTDAGASGSTLASTDAGASGSTLASTDAGASGSTLSSTDAGASGSTLASTDAAATSSQGHTT